MELLVFDLDGTLLDAQGRVSPHTAETLRLLRDRGVAYTVATGRTLHASKALIAGHGFDLPQVYKNGVLIWCPETQQFVQEMLLERAEVQTILSAFDQADVAAFVFTGQSDNHAVYHLPIRHDMERELARIVSEERHLQLSPIEDLPSGLCITNISALGEPDAIALVAAQVAREPHLVAYAGSAIEGHGWHWIDVHHSHASKGEAIKRLANQLGVSSVVCFGDSENDLSLFAMAQESYAPSNAKESVLSVATSVIGHHDEDGISHFLRKRYQL